MGLWDGIDKRHPNEHPVSGLSERPAPRTFEGMHMYAVSLFHMLSS